MSVSSAKVKMSTFHKSIMSSPHPHSSKPEGYLFSCFGTTSNNNHNAEKPISFESAIYTTAVPLFATLSSSYNPFTEWLDNGTPFHPKFDDAVRVQIIVTGIKDGLLTFALEACQIILDSLDPSDEPGHKALSESLLLNPTLWKAAILAQHYGVIHFMSRWEARSLYYPLMAQNPTTTDAIDKFLNSHDAASTRIINFAVHAYVLRGGLRVDHATSCVPPNCISAAGPRHVIVRDEDFARRSPQEVLTTATPMWDLHDFAHISCATLCPELYGNKYQSHLLRLPRKLTALVRSPGLRTTKGPLISDGLVFTEILTKLFTEAVSKDTDQKTYKSLTSDLAHTLAAYYLGERGLEHPSAGRILLLEVPITPTQLAVLAQNKRYELPASELEQRVFTRGGPANSKEDVFAGCSARRKAELLAESRTWTYFEVRNTIKHRAHKQAYKLVCDVLLGRVKDDTEKILLEKVRANIGYKDWENGDDIVLWDLL
jgi:hypothetical protein